MSTAPGFRLGNEGLDGIDSTGVDDHQDGSSGILTQGGIHLVGEFFFDSLVEASAVEAGSTVVQAASAKSCKAGSRNEVTSMVEVASGCLNGDRVGNKRAGGSGDSWHI